MLKPVRTKASAGSDEGGALIAVIGLAALATILSIGLVSSTIAATSYTSGVSADVQSTAAAQAGIDAAYASLNSGSTAGLKCTVASAAAPVYTATIAYYDSSGNALACSGTLAASAYASSATVTAVVTATGSAATDGSLATTFGNSSTVRAKFSIALTTTTTTTGATTPAMSDILYAGGNLTLGNTVSLVQSSTGANDADVYAAGSLSCNTASSIQGDVISQGALSIPNICPVTGTVWAGGAVTIASGAKVGGSLYAAGSVSMQNGGWVGGSLVASGPISIGYGGPWSCLVSGIYYLYNVCGVVASTGSTVSFANGASTAGSAYAKGTVDLGSVNSTKVVVGDVVSSTGNLTASNVANNSVAVGNSVKVTGTVSGLPAAAVGAAGSSCQYGASSGNPFAKCSAPQTIPTTTNPATSFPSTLGYPATVNAPPTQTMPAITASTGAWTSAGWTVTNVSSCTAAQSFLNGMSTSTPKTLLVIAGSANCAVSYSATQIVTYNDLAIMSPGGFSFTNASGFHSNTLTKRVLDLIVPTGSPGSIAFDNASFTNQYTLLYTPNTITLSNGLFSFFGQIYSGGTTSMPNVATLTMYPVTVPGVSGAASGGTTTTSTTVAASLLSRSGG